ncbi:hypothetical protein D3C71_1387680 [compost metagenome]
MNAANAICVLSQVLLGIYAGSQSKNSQWLKVVVSQRRLAGQVRQKGLLGQMILMIFSGLRMIRSKSWRSMPRTIMRENRRLQEIVAAKARFGITEQSLMNKQRP